MKLFTAGDKSQAICEACAAVVPTTFHYRDMPFDDGVGIATDILVATCDRCDTVVSVPAQSLPAVRSARSVADISLEAMLPAFDLEILDAAAVRISTTASVRFRKMLIAHFALKLASDPEAADRLRFLNKEIKRFDRERRTIIPKKRLSLKISRDLDNSIKELVQKSGLNKTAVLRGLVWTIRREVVDPDRPTNLEILRDQAVLLEA